MKASEIKELTVEDLKERINEQEGLYRKMKIDNVISEIENPLKIRSTRRTIARLKTELRARQIASAK